MTSNAPAGIEFRSITYPDSLTDPDAADFIAMARVRNQVSLEVSGHGDHHLTPAELLPMYHPDEYVQHRWWLICCDGQVVGRVGIDLQLEVGSRDAEIGVGLLRAVHGRGVGSQALELAERAAIEQGRTVLQGWAEHPERPGERLVPPTGFGSIPAADPAARFLVRHGYALEQIERFSGLDLTASTGRLEELLAKAIAKSADYRVVSWQLPTPQEYVAGYAWMLSRMSTDMPSAALEWAEEAWDAARIARHDESLLAGCQTMLVTTAQHIATGELCAFNELLIGPDRTRATRQESTLVLKEHRGHSLGMLVKCAGLLAWRDIAPESPRVITFNAEENRPMLDINESLGFVPISYYGAWKKTVAA